MTNTNKKTIAAVVVSTAVAAPIAAFVRSVVSHEASGAKLQVKLQEMISGAPDQKAFKTSLYEAAKAKGENPYAAIRKMYSRSLVALGLVTQDARGGANQRDTEKPTVEEKTTAKLEAAQLDDGIVIARIEGMAKVFLHKDDLEIFARLMACIKTKRAAASGSK